MLLRKTILFLGLFLFSNHIVIAQDLSEYELPKWHVKVFPLAYANIANPTLEMAFAKRINEKSLLQTSLGYIDHFYNETHTNRGFRAALDAQYLTEGLVNGEGLFWGAQVMYRQLISSNLELAVDRFGGAYQQFFPYKKRQDSWYSHCTIGQYGFIDKHFYFNWKLALGGRAYREYEITELPEDAELRETNLRFGVLDQPGNDWKLLPSLRLSLGFGFGWW